MVSFDPDNPADSIAALKRQVMLAKGAGDAAEVARLLGLVVRCHVLLGQLAKAQEALNDVEFVLINSRLRGTASEVLYLQEKAHCFEAMGWDEAAQGQRQQAEGLARKLG